VTGFYELGEVTAKTEHNKTQSVTAGVSSAIAAAAGVPIGGKIGPLKGGRILEANVELQEDSIWAARFHQLKVEYLQIATTGTTELPPGIMLQEDCTHPRGGLMKGSPIVKESKAVEAPQDIESANGAGLKIDLEEIEEIDEREQPEAKYWSAFAVAEKRLKRADPEEAEEDTDFEVDDESNDDESSHK
jgi:hypothetical protein